MFIGKRKVLAGTGYKIAIPVDWAKNNNLVHGTELCVIADQCLMYLPPRKLSASEIDNLVNDIKSMIVIAQKESTPRE